MTIINDSLFELPEVFSITIELPSGAPTSGIVLEPNVAVITILDDDGKWLWSVHSL